MALGEVADKYFNLGSSYRGRIVVDETSTSTSNNRSTIRIRVFVRKDAGSGYSASDPDARQWSVTGIGGTSPSSASGESSYNYTGATPQEDEIADFTRNVTHNDNGTWSDTISVSITHNNNPPGNGSTTVSFTLTNFPEPASGSFASSLITATTARLSAAVTTDGNGSSSTQEFQYRKTGDTTWISAGLGSPKDLTGLTPSTAYQWRVITENNNDNSSTSATQNFTTLPAAQAFGVFYGRKVGA